MPTPPPTPSRCDTSNDVVQEGPLAAPRFSPTKTAARQLHLLSLSISPGYPDTPIHVRARALLRSTTDSFNVIGRASERKFVASFLQPFIDGPSPDRSSCEQTSLYISGSPGTGKTALVMSVLATTQYDGVRTAYINCMGLKDINVMWGRVLPALGEASSSAKGKNIPSSLHRFEKKLQEVDFRWYADATFFIVRVHRLTDFARVSSVLVLDELDAFGPAALSAIFGLPARFPSSLRIIAISNDLTQSIASPTLSLHRPSSQLAFTAYTASEMQEIIRARLTLLCTEDGQGPSDEKAIAATLAQVIQPVALTLLVKKVSSQTGDIRHALEVLRRAIDLAAPATTALESDDLPPSPVGMKHVIDAVKRTPKNAAASPTAGAARGPLDGCVSSLSLQARFVLISILVARRRAAHNLPLDTLSHGAAFPPFSLPTPSSTPSTPSKSKMRRCLSMGNTDAPLSPSKVYTLYSNVLNASPEMPFPPVSRSEYTDLLGVLETASLISVPLASSPSPTKLKRGRKANSFTGGMMGGGVFGRDEGSVTLCAAEDEVLRALLTTGGEGNARDSEITRIWERESKRVERAIVTRAEAANAPAVLDREDYL